MTLRMVKTAIITAWFVGITIMFCLSARADECMLPLERQAEIVIHNIGTCDTDDMECIMDMLDQYYSNRALLCDD